MCLVIVQKKGLTYMSDNNTIIRVYYEVLSKFFRKWTLPIMLLLHSNGSGKRYHELLEDLNRISSITSKALSESLKILVDHGLIQRVLINTRPPTVEYKITEYGNQFIELLKPFLDWYTEKIQK